jgi:hypothetical protein
MGGIWKSPKIVGFFVSVGVAGGVSGIVVGLLVSTSMSAVLLVYMR